MRTRRFRAEQIIGILAEQIIGILKEHPQNLTRGARRQAVAWGDAQKGSRR